MTKAVVIDANRIFSALIAGNGTLRRILREPRDITFFCPKYVLVELFKHKEKTGLRKKGFTRFFKAAMD